jgi:fermentation-respiration switch protein FrsA (DUF1100 family)
MITNVIILLLGIGIFFYVGLMAFAYLVADKMIFPYAGPYAEPTNEVIFLQSSDGERIAAYYLPTAEQKQILLYSHGNGEDLESIRPHLERFQAKGLASFAYDYPGYGQSSGRATEAGVYASAEAAYQYVTETLGYAPEQVTLYGRSLGSGPSCWLAERYPVKGLILNGAFSSTFRVMTKVRLLPWDRFNNLSRLPSIDCAVLLLHGKQDLTVPFSHALQNERAASGPTQTLWHPDAGHNDLIEQLGSTYWDTVLPFANKGL